jgi:hypothetical protein
VSALTRDRIAEIRREAREFVEERGTTGARKPGRRPVVVRVSAEERARQIHRYLCERDRREFFKAKRIAAMQHLNGKAP